MNKKLILGTAQFGLDYGIHNQTGKLPSKEIFKVLDYAYANGIETLDTAEVYGNAIEIISSYHESCKNRFKILNKFKYQSGISLINTIKRVYVKNQLNP